MESKHHYLKSIVDNSGYKKTYIADKLNISLARLSNYLLGKRTMPNDIEMGIRFILDGK